MKKFELINYNFDEQRIDIKVNHPVKDGYIITRDIDLDATIYKMKIWDVQPGLHVFFTPTPRHGFDFQRADFGGFTFELIDQGVVLDREILRFRYTNLYKYKQNINDFYHPSFVNYREFFVDDKYKDFPLSNCKNVIDAGASVGLFTQYILNKGAKQVISVECDERSIKALQGNFYSNDNVTIIPKALSSDIGEQTLYWKDDNPLISTLTTNHSEFAQDINPNSRLIQTTTLEKIINDKKLGFASASQDVDFLYNNILKLTKLSEEELLNIKYIQLIKKLIRHSFYRLDHLIPILTTKLPFIVGSHL
jgi:FkbM family methyltransferase